MKLIVKFKNGLQEFFGVAYVVRYEEENEMVYAQVETNTGRRQIDFYLYSEYHDGMKEGKIVSITVDDETIYEVQE